MQLFILVLSDNVLFFPHNTLSRNCLPCWLYSGVYIQQLATVYAQKIFYLAKLLEDPLNVTSVQHYQVMSVLYSDVCLLILSILYILINPVNRPVYNNIFPIFTRNMSTLNLVIYTIH